MRSKSSYEEMKHKREVMEEIRRAKTHKCLGEKSEIPISEVKSEHNGEKSTERERTRSE
jgi:hypothetical protein